MADEQLPPVRRLSGIAAQDVAWLVGTAWRAGHVINWLRTPWGIDLRCTSCGWRVQTTLSDARAAADEVPRCPGWSK